MCEYKLLKNHIIENKLKYHIETYGCAMNNHESEKLAGILEQTGFTLGDKANADFIIFNTCCVRENAEQKTFGNVGKLKKRKKDNPNLIIAVCGCMTQQQDVAQKLIATFPFVDIVFGTHNLHRLKDLLNTHIINKQKVTEIVEDTQIYEDIAIKRSFPLASVNIMYGCNNYCSYCIVPYVRGRERSRTPQNILKEINTLANEGYREVMLLGQNVNSYNGGITFPKLLKEICLNTGIERIRFMTSHPKDATEELIEVMARHSKIAKHIHLPVQSGSTNILSMMNRGYTRQDYLNLVANIRKSIPSIAITTDIIVGFPTETEEDFKQTLSLIREVRFESAFTFVYSKRSGTKAAGMEGQISEEIKKQRIMELVALQNGITEEINKGHEGSVQRVLAESVSLRNNAHICGKTTGFKTVNFEGGKDLIGQFVDVKIIKGKKTTLFGEII